MNLGAKDTWNYIRSLERIGSGYTGMRAIPRKLREIMQIMSLLRMMIKILTRTGLSMPVSTPFVLIFPIMVIYGGME
jgi:hypothetical protein